MIIQTTLAFSNLANQAGHTQSQKTVDARKEGMFHIKIISSHLMGKAVNNYIQSILEIKLKCLVKILEG